MQTRDKDDTKAKQALRLRRFSVAIAVYTALAVFAQGCAWFGYLPAELPLRWSMAVAVVNLVFYGLLRSGWSLRLRDPSMTEVQIAVSVVAALALIAHADEARTSFLMFLPVPLLFGVLRLNFFEMARTGVVGVFGYAGVVLWLQDTRPERVQLDLEIFNLMALASVMVCVSLMCGYISRVRSDLTRAVATIGELAQRDALTGLFNRRHLMEKIDNEIARCDRRMGSGLTLCVVDIDHFKRLNDTFGHETGDHALVLVANSLSNSIRSVDYLARLGGEEFVVLLETDSKDLAGVIVERIRAQVMQVTTPLMGEWPLSVSIGYAQFAAGDDGLRLMKRADQALYQAKAQGRNRVCAGS